MKLRVISILVWWAGTLAAEPGTITLRTGQTVVADEIGTSVEGVECRVDGETRSYGWHQILDISGPASRSADEFRSMADDAWRGLSRLRRGDRVAAEPLLEDVFSHLSGHLGPTAQAVSEGLLVCRTARGAQALALEPYLTLMLSNQVDVTSDLLDSTTALSASLPPIWGTESGLTSVLAEIAADDFAQWGPTGRARQLAELYATAALFEVNGQAPVTIFVPVDGGVKLVQEIVHARVGDERQRADSRRKLLTRLDGDIPLWQQAWIHAAIGLSFLEENDERSTRLGIVQLLYVPAQHGQAQPYLAGVCLAEAAIKLAEMGRSSAAVRLAGELSIHYTDHAMIEHAIVRELIRQYREQSTAALPSEEDA